MFRSASRLLAILVVLFALPARPDAPSVSSGAIDQFIELDKSDVVFEVEAHFVGCPGPMHFKVQDGAMNFVALDGKAPVRFIVKARPAGDVRLHLVDEHVFSSAGSSKRGLIVRDGISMTTAVSREDLARGGLESLRLKSVSSTTQPSGAAAGTARSGTISPSMMPITCCDWAACGGRGGRYCTSGQVGCGGDGCGSCCI